jgi:hypothetical protein
MSAARDIGPKSSLRPGVRRLHPGAWGLIVPPHSPQSSSSRHFAHWSATRRHVPSRSRSGHQVRPNPSSSSHGGMLDIHFRFARVAARPLPPRCPTRPERECLPLVPPRFRPNHKRLSLTSSRFAPLPGGCRTAHLGTIRLGEAGVIFNSWFPGNRTSLVSDRSRFPGNLPSGVIFNSWFPGNRTSLVSDCSRFPGNRDRLPDSLSGTPGNRELKMTPLSRFHAEPITATGQPFGHLGEPRIENDPSLAVPRRTGHGYPAAVSRSHTTASERDREAQRRSRAHAPEAALPQRSARCMVGHGILVKARVHGASGAGGCARTEPR